MVSHNRESRVYPLRVRALLAALLLLLSAAAPAQLTWEATEVTLAPPLADRTATARFTCHNGGTSPVAILDLRTTCGCANATTSATTVAPGGDAVVSVVVTIGRATGTLRQRAFVTTPLSHDPTTLTVMVQVPDLAVVSPRILRWTADAPAAAKAVAIELAPGAGPATVTLRDLPPGLAATLRPGADDRHYDLQVTPRPGAAAGDMEFVIRVRLADGRQDDYRVFARLATTTPSP